MQQRLFEDSPAAIERDVPSIHIPDTLLVETVVLLGERDDPAANLTRKLISEIRLERWRASQQAMRRKKRTSSTGMT